MGGIKPVFIHPMPKLGGNFAKFAGKILFNMCTNQNTWDGTDLKNLIDLVSGFKIDTHEYVYGFHSDKEVGSYSTIIMFGNKKVGVCSCILKNDPEKAHYYINGLYVGHALSTYEVKHVYILENLLKTIYLGIYNNILK